MRHRAGSFWSFISPHKLDLIYPEFDISSLQASNLARIIFFKIAKVALVDFDEIWIRDREFDVTINQRGESLLRIEILVNDLGCPLE